MAYASTADLKAYLKISVATDDTLLASCLTRAQAIIDRATHKTFEASADTTRYFDAVRDVLDGGRTLFFDQQWIAQIGTNGVVNGDGVTIPSTAYVTEPRNAGPWYGIRLKSDADYIWTFSSSEEDAIAITGRWAYSVTAPADIVQATIRLAAYLYRQKDNATGDEDRPIMTGDGVTIMPQALPNDVFQLLQPFMPAMR